MNGFGRRLAHAVNVPEMVKYILYGHGEQSTGIFTPKMWFFDPNIKPFAYDPEKARQLLAEAGWKPGKDGILEKDGERFAFTLITNNGNEIRRDIATLVQDDLKKLGIEVKIELYEWAVFLKNFINKGSFDAMVLGWALGPDYDQYQIWHSSQSNPEQLNVVNYRNPTVDKLLVEIRQEYNRDKIIDLAGNLQEHHLSGSTLSFPLRSAGHVSHVEGQLSDPAPGRPGWLDQYAGGNDQSRLGLLHGLVLPTGVRVTTAKMSTARFPLMLTFISRRLLISAVLLFLISVISFFIITLTPGSPYPWGELNPRITPQVKEAFRKKFHLDRPLHEQYWLNMRDLFSGRLRSIKDDRPVLSRIAERLPATVSLNVLAIVLSLTFGLLLGVYAAKHAGRLPDVLTSILAFVFIALPGFWISDLIVIGLVKFTKRSDSRHPNLWYRFPERPLDVAGPLLAPCTSRDGPFDRRHCGAVALHPRQHDRDFARRLYPHRLGEGSGTRLSLLQARASQFHSPADHWHRRLVARTDWRFDHHRNNLRLPRAWAAGL